MNSDAVMAAMYALLAGEELKKKNHMQKQSITNRLGIHAETLTYSKSHEMWCTTKEFPYLATLIQGKKLNVIVTSTPVQPSAVKSGSAGPRTMEKEELPDVQKELRQMLKALMDIEKGNQFFRSLSMWRGSYSIKQADVIRRNYKEKIGTKKPEPEPEKWTTDEEDNDPTWTPWK